MSSRKRPRPSSPAIRVQRSQGHAGPSTERVQVNTHVHYGVGGTDTARLRHSVRTSHVARPEIVDLSGLMADEEESSRVLDANFDSFSEEDMLEASFGVDDDVVEQPEDGAEDGDNEEAAAASAEPVRLAQEWLPLRQTYVDELLRAEGLGETSQTTSCPYCSPDCQNEAKFKCEDCHGGTLACQQCLVERHEFLPLHRILSWNGSYFEKTSLYALGLRVYLGHGGKPCQMAHDIIDGFTLVDTTGTHSLKLVFCGCPDHPPPNIQLIRARWFPATNRSPRSGFTFEVLSLFQLLNNLGKLSLHHFYQTLHCKSDNVGLWGLKDRYDEMRPVLRIWRHLKMLKRAGRGHDPAGVAATRMGECAVECPACPHPNKNLPVGWEDAPEGIKWLYALLVTIDANFRMKLKDKGLAADPPMGDGWSHMVKTAPYKVYVEKYGHQTAPPTCDSNFRAADHTTSRTSTAFKASGVAGAICGRHGLVMKNGLGDMQKGEQQANIDFIVFSALFGLLIRAITFSYDICCQWSVHLPERIKQLPPTMQPAPELVSQAKLVLPKMHLHNHGESCQLNFNLNYLVESAQSDMEDPERVWAWENSGSMSTREMTDGTQYETICDHIAMWNWRKIVNFHKKLLRSIKVAVHMKMKSRVAFENFNKTFPPDITEAWGQLVKAWNKDRKQKNPYEEPTPSVTLASVMHELAVEETEATRQGIPQLHEMSPARFLQKGLDLEDQQRKQKALVKSKNSTLHRKTEVLEKRNTLRHRIDNWFEVQDLYMPLASQLREATPSSMVPYAEDEILYLPSQLPSEHLLSPTMASLLEKERCLRIGQADDALHEIRRLLRISSTILEFKKGQHLASQRITTKTRQLIINYHAKIVGVAERYIAAYDALGKLDPGGEWTTTFKPLNTAVDLHLPRREEEDEGPENRRELSWIWLVPRSADAQRRAATADKVGDSMRVEWAKTLARSDRWDEETQLLLEEMRRIIHYFHWKSKWWRRRMFRRTDASIAVQQGRGCGASGMWRASGMWQRVARERCELPDHFGPAREAPQRIPEPFSRAARPARASPAELVAESKYWA
ncbi:hypothetical protein HWV62_29262 [Athelia sp. TMB]|nr:hypothetical protein HWV62_29262 [Athelia sp. TMB]